MERRLDDLERGLNVIADKVDEKIAYLCGIAQQKYNIAPEDLEVEGGDEDGSAEGEEGEQPEEAGQEGAEGMEGQEGADAQAAGGDVPPDAAAQGVAPADAGAVPPDAAQAGAVPPDAAAQGAPDDQQQPVQEADESGDVNSIVSDIVKTPEDAAKFVKALQGGMNESAKKRFIKSCCGKIKENVEECRELDECAQNAFVKGYIKSFMKGYDELTESDEGEEGITQEQLESYIDSLDEDHTNRVFEDFAEECGMTEDEIREAADYSIDNEMNSVEEDERLEQAASEIEGGAEQS